MKLFFKNNFFQGLLSLIMIVSFMIIYHPLDSKKTSKAAFSMNNKKNSEISIDIDGNGIEDTAYIENSRIYVKINNTNICLNDCSKNKEFISSKSWPVKIFFKKISRKSSYDIIVQSQNTDNTKSKSKINVFTYSNNSFHEIYNKDSNIFGILDINTAKTPQCFSVESSIGNASKNAFMILCDKYKDITKNSSNVLDVTSVIKFIDIIQTDYEIEETSDIFSSSIPSEELGLIWNLDKEHNHYSFQNAYFENNSYDSEGNLTSISWELSFEKYPLNKDDSNKEELVLKIITQKENDSFKIASISKQNNDKNNMLSN